MRFAQRVQVALLPAGPPKRLKGVELAGAFAPARELGGDFHDFLSPESNTLVSPSATSRARACRRRSTARLPRELVRGRTFRRRYMPERSTPGRRAVVGQHDPPPASARGVLLHAVLRDLRPQAAHDDAGQLGAAVSDSLLRRDGARRSSCQACRSARSTGSTYDEVTFPLIAGDVFVFCTDGVFEAMNGARPGVHRRRACSTWSQRSRDLPPAKMVEAIFAAVAEWRGDTPPNDDMTAVAVRITG